MALAGSAVGLRLPAFPTFRRGAEIRSDKRARRQKGQRGVLSRSWVGMALVATVVGSSFLYAASLGGQYDAFVASYGTPRDLAAKLFGFEIEGVRISGLTELTEDEVLKASGVTDRNSLLFLDASETRAKLRNVPLVRDVAVRKLFPNSLVLEVAERAAAGLWQKDGQLSVVAADGVAIDAVHDARFNALPFVVGVGANEHLNEYTGLLESAGDLRGRIRAGIYVGQRRWTLQLDTGLEVMLPEIEPKQALARFAAIEQATRITDKDLISIDLRMPGRITARLSEDAAAARAEMLAKKPKKVSKE